MTSRNSWSAARDLAAIVGLLAVCWIVVFVAGGSRTALPHAFYVPVAIAALRFGLVGGVGVALAAGIAVGPLMPLNVEEATTQPLANWLIRLTFFVAIAALTALATDRLRGAISEQHAAAEERAELATARATVMQIVSHELRTPLTVIKGSFELWRDHDQLTREGRVLVSGVERAIERLEDLATLVIAAVDATPMHDRHVRRVTVFSVVEEAVASLASGYDRSRVELSELTQVAVDTEPEHLRLAVRLLIENALRFAPPETPVEVAVYANGNGDGHGLTIEIRDQGPGIPDAFTTGELVLQQGDGSTTRQHGGLGMGLYTANRLVDRIGGELHVARAEDGGTLATVRLPTTLMGGTSV